MKGFVCEKWGTFLSKFTTGNIKNMSIFIPNGKNFMKNGLQIREIYREKQGKFP